MKHTAMSASRRRGFTLIELLIVIGIIGILVAIVVPTYQSSVRKANEAAAVTTLNAIKVAEAKYVIDHQARYGTFKQLFAEGYVDKRLNADEPHLRGYIFILTILPKTDGVAESFSINANPEQATGIGATGRNFYYTDPENGICVSHDGPATANDENL
jgi:prepilin-type N-terminal cleavage/methylation domain-containing protein